MNTPKVNTPRTQEDKGAALALISAAVETQKALLILAKKISTIATPTKELPPPNYSETIDTALKLDQEIKYFFNWTHSFRTLLSGADESEVDTKTLLIDQWFNDYLAEFSELSKVLDIFTISIFASMERKEIPSDLSNRENTVCHDICAINFGTSISKLIDLQKLINAREKLDRESPVNNISSFRRLISKWVTAMKRDSAENWRMIWYRWIQELTEVELALEAVRIHKDHLDNKCSGPTRHVVYSLLLN